MDCFEISALRAWVNSGDGVSLDALQFCLSRVMVALGSRCAGSPEWEQLKDVEFELRIYIDQVAAEEGADDHLSSECIAAGIANNAPISPLENNTLAPAVTNELEEGRVKPLTGEELATLRSYLKSGAVAAKS